MKKWIGSKWFWGAISGVLIVIVGTYIIAMLGRPPAFPTKYELYKGVTYHRLVRYVPHSMIAHVIVIDRKTAEASFLVTPPDQVEGGTAKARTTSEFLEEFGVQIAVNGDGFFPWWSHSPVDYYPHRGDPVTPQGFASSFGDVYADGLQDPRPEPTLYVSRRNELTFNLPPNKIHHALSGDRMLILGGEIVQDLNDTILHPRTAIGINRNGRYVILVVVDGRQPFYSSGATFQELAELLKDFGAYFAMALDGGGSSTLVAQGENGGAVVLNSPIDNYIPGRERPVANHFGVFIDP
ncbi:MAG: phosphodiester glycosidase family protein [Chloroflexi bacterium]|nr:phosphodiester glycosidase family protein [Chloroflexota bacterium]MBI3168394.1 phosphodiester glycosidase family protein [Chloroflexota bacterium]